MLLIKKLLSQLNYKHYYKPTAYSVKFLNFYNILIIIFFTFNNLNTTDVKILLTSADPKTVTTWKISCSGDLYIGVPKQLNTRQKITTQKTNIITIKNQVIYFNQQKWSHHTIYLLPTENAHISLDGQPYHGLFLITKHQNKILLINYVELEDYICSVLKTECWPNWPAESFKVSAIASRSYITAKILETRRSKDRLPYHASNTNKHQTYSGIHNRPNIRQAVEDTKSIIVSYNKKPILAMFDCCCGGVIPAHMSEVDFIAAPYLKRTYPCNFCSSWKHYTWEAKFSAAQFKATIQKEFPKIKNISHIQLKRDRAGIVRLVTIKDGNKLYKLKGKLLYKLFKEIKSFSFSITKQANQIVVNGQGYGHHLGICQWGAYQMVKEGWEHKEILKFYFPGTQFMRIKQQNPEID